MAEPTPGELLFEFVRASDQVPMSCELHVTQGTVMTRAAAVRWAEEMRREMESETWMEPLTPVPIP